MQLRVLVVPDKFKGTLSAREAATAMALGWCRARPHDALELLPMSDGGDGFGEVISDLLNATPQAVRTVNAAHQPCQAMWWWQSKTKMAIIESAKIVGLAMLPPGKFHPFELDTFGLAAVLGAAKRKGAKQILTGIGGSATNDGGFGFARALGWEFLDRDGNCIKKWTHLNELATARRPLPHRFGRVIVAVDVQNALVGGRGATRVYGPQKGLTPTDLAHAERCLRRLAKVMQRESLRDLAKAPGAGAAGGLGFGLMAFCGAHLRPGFELFARHARLSEKLRSTDVVLTGEGAIDRSSAMGKGVGQLALRCRALGIPCLGLAGKVIGSRQMKLVFDQMHALTELTTEAQSKARPAFWLERLAARVGAGWRSS